MSQQPYSGGAMPHPSSVGPGATPALVRPTSGKAVTSFILSLLWIFGLGSLVAVVLSVMAMKETKTGMKGGHGLAVAGLVIGILGLVPVLLFMLVLVLGLATSGSTSP